MRKRVARKVRAEIQVSTTPALAERIMSELRELAGDLEIEVKAEERSSTSR